MSVDFSDHPVSLGEIRSDRSGDGSHWSPREMLVALLRQIDEGADIDAMVVCYRQNVDGDQRGRYYQSSPDGLVTMGLLSSTAIFMMRDK